MNILNSDIWAEFYDEGFFGFGEKGNFKYFSFWHFLPIIILIAGIILTYIFREKIRNSKHEKTFRLILGIVMLMAELGYFWRLLYAGPGNTTDHNLLDRLPLQVCEWTCIFAVLMVLTENKHFFDIDSFVCLTIGIAPLLLPAVIQTAGPAYFRYYQFWLEHIVPIYSVFYMMFVKGFKFNWKAIYKPLIFLAILGGFAIYCNATIENATYLYLQGDDLGPALTNLLGNNQFVRLAIFLPLVAGMFALEILIFHLINKHKMKKVLEVKAQ